MKLLQVAEMDNILGNKAQMYGTEWWLSLRQKVFVLLCERFL